MTEDEFQREMRESDRVMFVLRVLYYAVWPLTVTTMLITNYLTLGKAVEPPGRQPTHISRVANPPHP